MFVSACLLRKHVQSFSIVKRYLDKIPILFSNHRFYVTTFKYPYLDTDMLNGEMEKENKEYENAIETLNTLQSNAALITKIKKEDAGRRKQFQQNSLPEMEKLLARIDIEVDDLDQLNIVHISGTKGKGSVASFCESILRHSGLKTGFYSSPHMIEVRERIRLNGLPLEKTKFTHYFFECYNKLMDTANDHNGYMPGYFRFLTLMSFYVYLKEKLDAVIVEVGIGGSYDSTNIIRTPIVCGITMLELDHVAVLGDTIEQVANHKAGIMKSGRPTLALPQKYSDAANVFVQQANERNSTLQFVPTLDSYKNSNIVLGISGEHQTTNASLAMQLCRIWMLEKKDYLHQFHSTIHNDMHELLNTPVAENNQVINTFNPPTLFLQGLRHTKWAGRCEVVKRDNVSFYMDGAHTPGSIEACVKWVHSRINKDVDVSRDRIFRVLLFNINRSERDHTAILKSLSSIGFDYAVFCPNIIDSNPDNNSRDMQNYNTTLDNNFRMCERNKETWLTLQPLQSQDNISTVFPCLSSAVRWVCNGRDPEIQKPVDGGPEVPLKMAECEHIQIVVTGTLHLVGGLMKYLGPIYEKSIDRP